ncbi:MAG: hypothetical protein RR954_09750 [Christensenellaceae bacterium]
MIGVGGKPPKEFQEYLIERENAKAMVSHGDYQLSPASAFLRYTVEAKDAIKSCIRQFPKNMDGKYTKASIDSLQHLIVATLPAIMGHFETYQRYLFAGMFDYSVYLKNLDIKKFVEALNKACGDRLDLDLVRLAAHRGLGVSSIGVLVADCLPGWQNPRQVNGYFNAFGMKKDLFSQSDCQKIFVLLQLRHSIVHTGGTITLADAQKVPALAEYADRNITFGNNFIYEVSRKMHQMIKRATSNIGDAYVARLVDDIPVAKKASIEKLFEVKSSIHVWLKP